jgi:transcriptional regulator with XRE-family HTH domain
VKKRIGKKIRELREQTDLKQHHIAAKLGMSATNYAKIERGEVEISAIRLYKIARILKVEIGYFFTT